MNEDAGATGVEWGLEMNPPGPESTVPRRKHRMSPKWRAALEVMWEANRQRARVLSLEVKMQNYEVTPEGCNRWLGRFASTGYGRLSHAGRALYAHRVAYELAFGAIPSGLTLDHLCRNRWCVNPTHLEPVTLDENKRRGMSLPAIYARASACPRGHAWTPENTYIRPDTGTRMCRTCQRARK
jgi:hypothetical protein